MLFGTSGRSEVRVGDIAPDFSLNDQDDHTVTLSELRGKPVVLFFYPKDDTPGCKVEACSFRDSHQAFIQKGATVIGISSDDKSTHQRFANKHQLTFPLLADMGGAIRKLYGVPSTLGILPGRVTYVIAPDGVVNQRIVSQFDPNKHIREALEALDVLTATTS